MYYHSQDLRKEDKHWSLIHWRCWIGQNPEFTFYINFPTRFWHLKLDLCENGWQEEAIGLSFAAFGLYLAVGFRSRWLYGVLEPITKRKDQKYTNGRTIGIAAHDGKLWIDLWNDPMESRSRDPKWWHFTFDPMDMLFGKREYTEKVLQEGEVNIDMPEGVYKATFKRFISYWKRPRWFGVKQLDRISIDIPAGIPHEGKGENSWDMGMDATFGVTMPAPKDEPMHQIVDRFAISCLKDRQKHGNLHSPDYAKWKLEREIAVEKEKALANQHDIPEDLVPRAFGEIKEREV